MGIIYVLGFGAVGLAALAVFITMLHYALTRKSRQTGPIPPYK